MSVGNESPQEEMSVERDAQEHSVKRVLCTSYIYVYILYIYIYICVYIYIDAYIYIYIYVCRLNWRRYIIVLTNVPLHARRCTVQMEIELEKTYVNTSTCTKVRTQIYSENADRSGGGACIYILCNTYRYIYVYL